MSLQITAEQLLREVRPIFLSGDLYRNIDLSNRLKNDKRLHFVRLNNELKISRNSVNIVDVKERNLKRESEGQEGACEPQYSLKDGLFLIHTTIQKRMVAIRELGGMSSRQTNYVFHSNFSLLRPPKMNLRARGLSSNVPSMSTQEASNFGSPTPRWN